MLYGHHFTTVQISIDTAVSTGNIADLWLATVESVDGNALLTACENGQTEIVRLLIELPSERGAMREQKCKECNERSVSKQLLTKY
jgi:hypothetical protein